MSRPGDIPYPFLVTQRRNLDGSTTWEAEAIDLPGCIAAADSPARLFDLVSKAQHDWIASARGDGVDLPAVVSEQQYSGRLSLRLPPFVHRAAAIGARRAGVSLNSYLNALIAYRSGAGARSQVVHIHIASSPSGTGFAAGVVPGEQWQGARTSRAPLYVLPGGGKESAAN